MIFVGIDDTDTLDTPGTNQLARALAVRVSALCRCLRIVRHQLFFDPRVPYTSKNGCASMQFQPLGTLDLPRFIDELRAGMRAWFKPGSDPGLCVAQSVPPEVVALARRCQHDLVQQQEARDLATAAGVHLEGLGGTEDGVIGALSAIGLSATNDDGRVVQLGPWLDDLTGRQPIPLIRERGIDVRDAASHRSVTDGIVDVGKKLRPNCRAGKIVLFVTPVTCDEAPWQALRLL